MSVAAYVFVLDVYGRNEAIQWPTGCVKNKSTPKVFCSFLSNRLGFYIFV